MAQKIFPPPEITRAVRTEYKGLISAAAQARIQMGKKSAEYAACTISLSSYVAAISTAYGFDSLSLAHLWLQQDA